MKAIIVPGITDLNKGDQALVWESHRLIDSLKIFNDIYILQGGDTEEEKKQLSSQTKQRGYNLVQGLLKHPRRGRHSSDQHIIESKTSYIKLISYGIRDFITSSSMLCIANYSFLCTIVYGKETNKKLQDFRDCDVIFVKGGGFIHAHGEFFSPYLIWYSLFYMRLGKKLGKKVLVLPNSFGPFKGITVKKQIKSALENCDKVYARESVSAKALSRLLRMTITVRPDLGLFLLASQNTKIIDNLLQKYGLNHEDKIIGLTVRPWRFPGHTNPTQLYNNYIQSIVALASHARSKGYKVVVCNQSIGPNSHEDDRNAIKDLMAIAKDIIWINEDLACDVLKALYSRFYCLIGTRFHSVIFSLTSNIPCIAIGYGGNKAKGIMEEFGLNDFVVPIHEVEGEVLIAMFNKLEDEYANLSSHLSSKVQEINLIRENLVQELKEIVI